MTKTNKAAAKPGQAGGKASGDASAYWHRAACRVYLHFVNNEPNVKGDKRLEKAASLLNAMGFRSKGEVKITLEGVRGAIRRAKASGEFADIQRTVDTDTLLTIDPHLEKEAAIAADITFDKHGNKILTSWELATATAALCKSLPIESPAAQEFERKRTYQSIAVRGVMRLRTVLRECELAWDAAKAASLAAGVAVKDFPADEIISSAFPNLKRSARR